MDLDDFLERFGIKEETEASTVNGWVTRHIDKIPEEGDSFVYEDEGQKLVVKAAEEGIADIENSLDPSRIRAQDDEKGSAQDDEKRVSG